MKWLVLVMLGCGAPYVRPPSPMATIYLGEHGNPWTIHACPELQVDSLPPTDGPYAEIAPELVVQELVARAVGDKQRRAADDETYEACVRRYTTHARVGS